VSKLLHLPSEMQRSEAWLIAVCLARRFFLSASTADGDFSMHNGYIAGGSDIGSKYITVTEAKSHCSKTSECKGFTFMGPPSEGPMWINFKSDWNIGGDGWTSYRYNLRASLPPQTDFAAPEQQEQQIGGSLVTSEQEEQPTGSSSSVEKSESYRASIAPSLLAAEQSEQLTSKTSNSKSSDVAEVKSEAPVVADTASEGTSNTHIDASNTDMPFLSEHAEELRSSSSGADSLAASEMGSLADTSSAHGSKSPDKEPVPRSDADIMTQPESIVQEQEGGIGAAELPQSSSIQAKVAQLSEPALEAIPPVNDGLLRARMQTRKPHAVQPTNYSQSLFVGRLTAMTQRNIVGLSKDVVVFCYASPEVGGACMAGNASVITIEASSEDTRSLSPLHWGVADVFSESQIGRLEVVRLTPVRFAVCFERISDSIVLCLAGAVVGGESADFRCVLGPLTMLGNGRLMSASPSRAGQQIAACLAEKQDGRVSCKWAHVQQEQETLRLSWIDSEAQTVRTF